jgi:hypothetical protein
MQMLLMEAAAAWVKRQKENTTRKEKAEKGKSICKFIHLIKT